MAEGHDHRGVENQHGYEPRSPLLRRIKKNFKTWCKGKVGTRHTPTFGYPANLPTYVSERNAGACHEFADRWYCEHAVYCTTCGKILIRNPADLCPLRIEHENAKQVKET